MTKIIAILNQKGGVGKTTTSINLAIGLGRKGYRVLEIDMDPQANSTDLLSDETSKIYIDEILEAGDAAVPYSTQYENVFYIPARLELALTEKRILLSSKAQHNRLYKVLRPIMDDFDYMIIDCPPILNILTVNALYCCNDVIIPIKIDRAAEKGFRITLQNMQEIAESYDLDIKYKVLFTMVHRSRIDREKIESIRELCDGNDIHTTIRHQEKPITEAGYKKGCVIGSKTSVGADYEALADELIAMWEV